MHRGAKKPYCGNHFTIFVYQTIPLYTLNLRVTSWGEKISDLLICVCFLFFSVNLPQIQTLLSDTLNSNYM